MPKKWAYLTVPLVLALVGAILAIVGVLGMTVLRPDGELTASDESPSAPYTMTHAGVLNLVDPPVKVRAKAASADEPVTVVLGRPADVAAWLEGTNYREIAGLVTWKDLKAVDHPASEEAPEPGSPAESDMWLESMTENGEVEFTVTEDQSELSVLAATDGQKPAPTLTLTWHRPVSVAWAIALTVVGAILMLVGLALYFQMRRLRRSRLQREEELTRQTRQHHAAEVITTEVSGKSVKLPSRQAMREARERGESTVTVGGQTFDTGLIPVVKKIDEVSEPVSAEEKKGESES